MSCLVTSSARSWTRRLSKISCVERSPITSYFFSSSSINFVIAKKIRGGGIWQFKCWKIQLVSKFLCWMQILPIRLHLDFQIYIFLSFPYIRDSQSGESFRVPEGSWNNRLIFWLPSGVYPWYSHTVWNSLKCSYTKQYKHSMGQFTRTQASQPVVSQIKQLS